MNIILVSIIVLGGMGILSAAVLYIVANKFHVVEDPRVEAVEEALPGANCGACGFSGCHDFAAKCVCSASLDGFYCPVGGENSMKRVAEIMGMNVGAASPKIAVVRCNGTCENRPVKNRYDGAHSCAILAMTAVGTSDCAYGCLGEGDCARACPFGAISIDEFSGMPVVDENVCTGCGVCVAACPRSLIELRNKGPRGMRVYVACVNEEKGSVAKRECDVSCIGCSKCVKVCNHDAINVENNLAYIDFEKCKLCRKCVDQCPTHAIHAVNFPKPKLSKNIEEK